MGSEGDSNFKTDRVEVVFHPFRKGVSSVLSNLPHALTWVVAKGPVQVFQSLKNMGSNNECA